ncbi:hypothetical protein KCU85_g336, partial [Aureobasidium melanogenum]
MIPNIHDHHEHQASSIEPQHQASFMEPHQLHHLSSTTYFAYHAVVYNTSYASGLRFCFFFIFSFFFHRNRNIAATAAIRPEHKPALCCQTSTAITSIRVTTSTQMAFQVIHSSFIHSSERRIATKTRSKTKSITNRKKNRPKKKKAPCRLPSFTSLSTSGLFGHHYQGDLITTPTSHRHSDYKIEQPKHNLEQPLLPRITSLTLMKRNRHQRGYHRMP